MQDLLGHGSLHGVMYKRRRGRKHIALHTWKERLFVLYPQSMKIVYFMVPEVSYNWTQTNPPTELRRGELTLIDAVVTSKTEAEAGKPFSFHIFSAGGELTLAATKASQREEWLRALKCLSPPAHLLNPNTCFTPDTSPPPPDSHITSGSFDEETQVFHMDSWSSSDSLDQYHNRRHQPLHGAGITAMSRRKKRLDSGLLLANFNDLHVSPATSEEEESPRVSDEQHRPVIVKQLAHRSSANKRRLREMAMEANALSAAHQEHLQRIARNQRQLQEMTLHEQDILSDWEQFGVKPTISTDSTTENNDF